MPELLLDEPPTSAFAPFRHEAMGASFAQALLPPVSQISRRKMELAHAPSPVGSVSFFVMRSAIRAGWVSLVDSVVLWRSRGWPSLC